MCSIKSRNPGGSNAGTRNAPFPRFPQNGQGQRRPFFSQQGYQGNRPQQGGNQSYNSSNAPRQYNNRPVPMDLDRTRSPNWRGRGRGNYQGRAAQVGNPRNHALNTPRNNAPLTCFNCNQQGHYARNCPERRPRPDNRTNANLIDWNDDDAYLDNEEEEATDHIKELKTQLRKLSLDDANKLADEMGIEGDFPSA